MASLAQNLEKKEDKLDNYTYRNKKSSRKLISLYLLARFDNFSNKKALVLSSWQGLDIDQVFDEIGFRRKNLTVIEREEKVYNLMKKSPAFTGVTLHHMDLKNFRSDEKFDVLYLDFKCQSTDEVLDIIRKLLLFNTRSGTVDYINLLAKREKRYITDNYNKIEESTKKQIQLLNEMVDKSTKIHDKKLRRLVQLICNRIGTNDPKFQETLIKDKVKLKYLIRTIKHSLTCNDKRVKELIKEYEKIDRFESSKDIFKRFTFQDKLKTVQSRNNDHILRATFIRNFVWDTFNLVLQNYQLHNRRKCTRKNFVKFFSNCQPQYNTDKGGVNMKTIKYDMVMTLLRLITNSLSIENVTQFIYYSKERSPFLSSLFYLTDADALLTNKFPSHSKEKRDILLSIIFCTFQVLNLFMRKKLNIDQLSNALKKIFKERILESDFGSSLYTKDMQSEWINAELEIILEMYKDLRRCGIVLLESNQLNLKTYSYNYKPFTYNYDLKWGNHLLNEESEAPEIIGTFYMIMDSIRGRIADRINAVSMKEITVIDSPIVDFLFEDRDELERDQIEESHEEYYITAHDEETKAWIKVQNNNYITKRGALLRKYTEIYYDEKDLLSCDIAAIINRKEEPFPFITDFDVRWEKVRITRERREQG